MTKLLSTLTLLLAFGTFGFAQETTYPATDRANDVSEERQEDVDRMLENYADVKLREVAINYLDLSTEEIEEFTPIFLNYTQASDDIENRRRALLASKSEELDPSQTEKKLNDNKADFIENYLELNIDKLELQKDYFDRLEDEIGPEKALTFFTLEDAMRRRANRAVLRETMPSIVVLEPVYLSYDREISDFNNWKRVNIDGEVGLGHDFTSTGLQKLVSAAEKMAVAERISVDNFTTRKNMIMDKADALTKNWESLNHADYARDAFIATYELLTDVAESSPFTVSKNYVNRLEQAAMAIQPEVKLTDQSAEVYNFFDVAQAIVNNLVDQARNSDPVMKAGE